MPSAIKHKYLATEHEKLLRDSGMFTQIQPEWLAESEGAADYISIARKVFVHVNRIRIDARVFIDTNETTYQSIGWYTPEEIAKWLLPVMKSDRAWSHYLKQTDGDLTIALDYL